MTKLTDILKEAGIELGKVYTDKDKPPFQTSQQIKEVGMSADIKKYQNAIDKDMMNLSKSVNALKDILIKNGAKKEAQELGSIFVTNVGKFRNFIKVKFIRMIRKMI